MKLVVLAMLSTVGCNAVFDIDETRVVELATDSDGDGVYDFEDNCVAVVNPDQANGDGDALGDACDRCVGVQADSDYDEDLDGRPDGCDVCPAIADFKVDVDGDGVGDPCDRDSHMTERLRFEPFITIPPVWQGAEMWSVTPEGNVGPVAALPLDSRGLVLTDVNVSATEWSATLGVLATRKWSAGDRAGFVATNPDGALTACLMVCDGNANCALDLVVDGIKGQTVPFPRATYERLSFEVKQINASTNTYSYSCEATIGLAYVERTPAMASWTPGIIASPTLRITYVDLVQ